MFLPALLSFLLSIFGILLMFVILLQRGRGGGLAGAFGGLGGQSAFGTKAGDVFTRITIGMSIIWVVLASTAGFAMREPEGRFKSEARDESAIISIDEDNADKADDLFNPGAESAEAGSATVGETSGISVPAGSEDASSSTEDNKEAADENGDKGDDPASGEK